MQRCPFCDAPEAERFELEGRLYLVFPCMFTAKFDRGADESTIQDELESRYGGQGGPFFRRTCDLLHLYVTKGAGATVLLGEPRTAELSES